MATLQPPSYRTSISASLHPHIKKNSEIKIFSAKIWQNKNGTFSPVCDFIVKNGNFLKKKCYFIVLIFNEIIFNTP